MTRLSDIPLRWKLLGSFALILALLVGLSVAAYRTTAENEEAAEALADTLRVIALANEALAGLVDMESAYRGFLITGRDEFLEPYGLGQEIFTRSLAELKSETADSAAQQARWRDVEDRVETWQREVTEPDIQLRRAVNLGEASLDEVATRVARGEGKRQFDEIRRLFVEAERDEEEFLEVRRRQATEASLRLQQTLVVGSVVALVLALLLARFLARDVVGAVDRLANTATSIAGGDLAQRIGFGRRDEIGQAGAAFDRMTDQLQGMIQRNDTILRTAAEGIFGLDRDGRTMFANPAAIRATGYTRQEIIGQHQHSLIHHSRGDGTPYPSEECPIYRSLTEGVPSRGADEVFWRKDGTSFPIEYTSAAIREADEIVGAVVTFRDITDRLEAERALQERARELARSNAELEQFAYVASHDLQEPLRAVVSYLQLLERRYKGQLDERSDRYIGHAVDGARRMQTLINDLLAYSRVGRRGEAVVPTDAEAVFDRVLASLRTAIEEHDATVTHDPLPTVTADATQLGQLLQNLVGNGLKFRGDSPPTVHVSAERHDGEWLFSVRDNGIGIEPEYAERIFVLFQRLHGRSEYPGTGIGLAICKKIVERHGGRLWVESTPGHGSTFLFTLPEQGDGEP
jgi:PAS domain S-box-containing protein